MDNFQVDVILNSLQDLKQVRERNEKRLAQECARRIDLESRLEMVTSRHSATVAKKTAAMETLKIATQQSSLSEAQRSSLEQRCREKREEVRLLNDQMEEQKRKEETTLAEFSRKMTELTEKFRSARVYYTEPQLVSDVDVCTNETEAMRERVAEKRADLSGLKNELSRLQQQHQLGEGERDGIDKKQWLIALDMVTNERGVAKAELEREEQELRLLRQQFEEQTKDLQSRAPRREE